MATPPVREFALRRDYTPSDANIDYGLAVVFAVKGSTITLADGSTRVADDMTVVLPNNANALPRAFAGFMQGTGEQGNIYVTTPLDLLSDNRIDVEKDWLPEAILAPDAFCTIGDELGYDPADTANPGTLQKHVSGVTVKCAIAQGTYQASSDPQTILVQAIPPDAVSRGGVYDINGTGSNLTNTTTETVLSTIALPQAILPQIQELLIESISDVSSVNAGDKLIVAVYFHPTSVVFNGTGSAKVATTATAGGGTVAVANDQIIFRLALGLTGDTTFTALGSSSFGQLGAASTLSAGLQGQQTWNDAVGWSISVTGKYNAASASNIVRQQSLAVRVA
jgi:hypothetical protein